MNWKLELNEPEQTGKLIYSYLSIGTAKPNNLIWSLYYYSFFSTATATQACTIETCARFDLSKELADLFLVFSLQS